RRQCRCHSPARRATQANLAGSHLSRDSGRPCQASHSDRQSLRFALYPPALSPSAPRRSRNSNCSPSRRLSDASVDSSRYQSLPLPDAPASLVATLPPFSPWAQRPSVFRKCAASWVPALSARQRRDLPVALLLSPPWVG